MNNYSLYLGIVFFVSGIIALDTKKPKRSKFFGAICVLSVLLYFILRALG